MSRWVASSRRAAMDEPLAARVAGAGKARASASAPPRFPEVEKRFRVLI